MTLFAPSGAALSTRRGVMTLGRGPVLRLVLIACLMPASALAQEDIIARYQVRFGPLRVADVMFQATETDSAYAAAGRVTSAGLAGAFRDIRFALSSQGWRDGTGPVPHFYREDVDTGRRVSEVEISYLSGIPSVQRIMPDPPPAAWDLSPEDQAGTLDPMSALYILARPRPLARLCDWSVAVFDGRRRSVLRLDPAETDGQDATCEGAYQRVAGFPPEDMAERRVFPFQATFTAMANGDWRLTRVETQTLYGRVRILLLV